jgi:alpha-beta hydrolase superfamily lysophospholipase
MKTLSALARALLFWLGALEWLAGRQGWWGLSWLGRGSQRTLVGPLLAAPLGMPGGRWRHALSFILAAPLALAIQIGASSLRNRRADPRAGLRPGTHPGRRVEHVHIAMDEGFLPGILAAPGTETAAAVCILHGSGDHKGAYTWWMVDALLAQNIAVLLIDLDGHGENPRTQQFPAILDDVRAATDYLRARYRRVGVLGISLGGCIAARAVADGTPVDALVLMEAPPLLHFTRADMRREALALAHWPAMQVFRNTSVHQIVDTWSTAPIRAAISTWDLIAALDLLGSVKRIQAPLFLLYGGRDAIVKPAQAAEVRDAAPPHATFSIVPGASHLTLFLRRDVQERIARWFASQLHG